MRLWAVVVSFVMCGDALYLRFCSERVTWYDCLWNMKIGTTQPATMPTMTSVVSVELWAKRMRYLMVNDSGKITMLMRSRIAL